MLKPGNYANMAADLMGLSKAVGSSGGQDGGQSALRKKRPFGDSIDPCVEAEMLEKMLEKSPYRSDGYLERKIAIAKSKCKKYITPPKILNVS